MHIFIHLLNDFSGSPRTINEKISCYRQLGYDCFVITSGNSGFIRTDNLKHKIIFYEKHRNRFMWVIRLFHWHLKTFFWVLCQTKRSDVVHCNTLLTAPHLLAARIKGAKTICHIHETMVSQPLHKFILTAFVRLWAGKLVYVSTYVEKAFKTQFSRIPYCITYPCVDQQILGSATAQVSVAKKERPFTVGLICSLIWHKGYVEFIHLATMCADFRFVLVINGLSDSFYEKISSTDLPSNLEVHFSVKDVSKVLNDIDILLSLTKREGWVETFGLTLIEAMSFGVPVIAPNIGAPTEYIQSGRNGYLVNESDLPAIAELLISIQANPRLYTSMSGAARETSKRFTPAVFLTAVHAEIQFVFG
jgi:glycosyltransferase involved in cell wall biosynthesis